MSVADIVSMALAVVAIAIASFVIGSTVGGRARATGHVTIHHSRKPSERPVPLPPRHSGYRPQSGNPSERTAYPPKPPSGRGGGSR